MMAVVVVERKQKGQERTGHQNFYLS